MSFHQLPPASREYQLAEFLDANIDSKFPPGVEGYWRRQKELPQRNADAESPLPWPVVYYDIDGYDMTLFLSCLKKLEDNPSVTVHNYRGVSINRLNGRMNGSREYEYRGWRWPEGYRNYINMGVPPSRAFHKFVTGIYLPNLPSYGHEQTK